MKRVTNWTLILLYVASDVCINVAARSFQIFFTWYLVKVEERADLLSILLMAIWVTSTILLPFAGVLVEHFRKTSILLISASATIVTSVGLGALALAITYRSAPHFFSISLILAIVASTATALATPLSAPLIPKIAVGEVEIHRAMRLRSSLFIVNLLLGPTLAGFLIGIFGGNAAIFLGVVAASFGFSFALVFKVAFSEPLQVNEKKLNPLYFITQLQSGIIRVLQIPAERIIGASSLLTNMILVPFLFLILPAKLLRAGMSMLDLAFVEIGLGLGILLASTILVVRLQNKLSDHTIASIGVVLIGIPIVCFAFLDNISAMFISALVLGCGLTTFNVTVNAKRATAIPDGYRSTMEATLRFFCVLSVPVGLWFSDVGLKEVGPNSVLALAAIPLIASMAMIIFSSSLRSMLNTPRVVGDPYYATIYSRFFKKE